MAARAMELDPMSDGAVHGIFLSFEGGEGCGKSTQIERLVAACQNIGVDVLVFREPGGTPVGENIRRLLKYAPEASGMTPEAELLLFAASRAQLVRTQILPALKAGAVVISDRYVDSTTVYQGAGRGLDPEAVAAINHFVTDGRLPDLTFLLDMPAAAARVRLLRRPRPVNSPQDRMENEPLDFYERIRAAYLALAADDPTRFAVLDASRPEADVSGEILRVVSGRFPERLHALQVCR